VHAFLTIAVVQAKLFLREPPAFFFTLVFPVLVIAIFGAMFGNTPSPAFDPNYGYIDHETPAMIGIIIATIALMGIPIEVASSREKKILRCYRATPLRPATYLTATISVYFALAIAGMIITVIFAKVVYDLRFDGNWFSFFLGLTLSAVSFFSVGYLIASLASTARIAQTVGQVLFFPMLFLSGATFPLVMMPDNVRQVSEFLPLTHAVKLLQHLWFGGNWLDAWFQVLVLAATLGVGMVTAALAFRWE
jgi:ABC-2 type transport system permease protein